MKSPCSRCQPLHRLPDRRHVRRQQWDLYPSDQPRTSLGAALFGRMDFHGWLGRFPSCAGIQIQAMPRGSHRKTEAPFSPRVFKGDYGPRDWSFAVFPDSPITRSTRSCCGRTFNYSWLHWSPQQRTRAQRSRDAWMKDSMRAMGGLGAHNRYVHLFLNGLYWGI